MHTATDTAYAAMEDDLNNFLHNAPTGRYLMADYSDAMPQPRDPEFNTAVLRIARNLFPDGFDVVPPIEAPNTWAELFDRCYGKRMVVSASTDPEDVFRDNTVYHAFRAWHDHTHLFVGGAFTLTGEAIVARVQEAQLVAMYGEAKAKRWMGYIHDEIITANFGDTNAIDETRLVLGEAA